MNPFGFSRSVVVRDHAVIDPASHVRAPLPGWQRTDGVILIGPALGARFSQFLAHLEPGGTWAPPLEGVERFAYVAEGRVVLGELGGVEIRTDGGPSEPGGGLAATGAGPTKPEGSPTELGPGGYAYLPAGSFRPLKALEPSRLIVFEKRFEPLPGAGEPEPVAGWEQEIEAVPFEGDPHARLKSLLPGGPAFDMAVNLFTFDPGAALPLVEVHVMEHGLTLLEGRGIYRLGERWYPVQAGDTLWIGPFCPQWFTAVRPGPTRYLYYKDVHRDPMGTRP